jgi:pimeloyl-ACP methyl ester carboxylesterase
METHILDVANVLIYEDMHDVILVGHSMGGIVIPFVALRVPERIKQVVWLTAEVIPDGARGVDRDSGEASPWLARAFAARERGEPRDVVNDLLLDAFMQDAPDEVRQWAKVRLGGPAAAIRNEPSRLSDFLALGIPTAYIYATRDQALPLEVQHVFAARLGTPVTAEVDGDHNLMVTAAGATANALEAVAATH